MNLQSELNKLEGTLTEIAALSSFASRINQKVSSASVGWHMQHIYLATYQMAEQLKKSNEAEYRYRPNISRTFVFTLKKIPRGKGKAPKASRPETIPSEALLSEQFHQLKNSLQALQSLNPKQYFNHYLFGSLNRNHTVKLMGIHARHHLAIIREIIQAESKM